MSTRDFDTRRLDLRARDLNVPVDFCRTLIIGNGGSGKTWLSRELQRGLRLPVIHLDSLRWEPGHTGVARDNQTVADEVRAASDAECWVIEGVYGWLASIVVPRATMLIWLDVPERECLDNVRRRGRQQGESEQGFEDFLEWVAGYRTRSNSSCFAAHSALYEAFKAPKVRLTDRSGIARYVADLPDDAHDH